MTPIIRLPDSLGCTVASTSVVISLIEKYGEAKVVTPFRELLNNIENVKITSPNIGENIKYDVDLRLYTSRRPHNNYPYRPSYIHMLEMAEENLKIKLSRLKPKVNLTKLELKYGETEVSKYKKPLIWYQSQATTSNRQWCKYKWNELVDSLSDKFSFIDLSLKSYSLRQSLSVSKACYAGICLDSFMVHGSAAVEANNVIVILGSSRSECVVYPRQYVLYKNSQCQFQPCGMHGYFNGCSVESEVHFSGKNCVYASPICMESISIEHVKKALYELTNSEREPVYD
ncbi:hypothetical protein [Vibrio maritimus]|uniref:hypothetical protein n=1 Tax=Vibrio maritimus TaxID=990268 RepID=UPI001F1B6F0F|nr:hypothetical protein [Vibrio maritimus]